MGDGIGHLAGSAEQADGSRFEGRRRVIVPGALPGERARVSMPIPDESSKDTRGSLVEIVRASDSRVSAPCGHFGTCGGCSIQHLADSDYTAWKRDLVVAALDRAGVDAKTIQPLQRSPPGSRRRADMVVQRRKGGTITVAYRQRGSHTLVGLNECAVLDPRLWAGINALKPHLAALLTGDDTLSLQATWTDSGLDVFLTLQRELDLPGREALADMASRCDLARLVVEEGTEGLPPTVLERRTPAIAIETDRSKIQAFPGEPPLLYPPPGGFLQATADGQRALASVVIGAAQCAVRLPLEVPRASKTGDPRLIDQGVQILDLYAGSGTFSLPLAGIGAVHAVESNEAAVGALRGAAHRQSLAVTAEVGDLDRAPVLADRMEGLAAVIFDPPRAGARAQAEQLAIAQVGCIIAVSCNPNTFARDARILTDGGWILSEVVPVDQFLWTGHLELVGVFWRG
ncbi:MAG: hypothetical protein AAF220_03685 [Pseudomonadota bacterium]